MSVFTDSANVNTVANASAVGIVKVIGVGATSNAVATATARFLLLAVGVASVNTVANASAVGVDKVIGSANVNTVTTESSTSLIRLTARSTVNTVANASAVAVKGIIGKSSVNTVTSMSAVGVYKVRGSSVVNAITAASARGTSGIIGASSVNSVTSATARGVVKKFGVGTTTNTVVNASAVQLIRVPSRSSVNTVTNATAIGVVKVIGRSSVNTVTTTANVTHSVRGNASVNTVTTASAVPVVKIIGKANVSTVTSAMSLLPTILDKFGKPIPKPTWYDRYWSALLAVILATWPEVRGKVSMDIAVERRDWVVELSNGKLTAPWCTVVLDFVPSADRGPFPRYDMTATVYYIASLKDAVAGVPSTWFAVAGDWPAATYLTDKLIALQQAIYADMTMGSHIDAQAINVGADNPINVSFIDSKSTYQAGSIQITTIIPGVA